MWTGIFPKRLTANLPASAMDNFSAIYGDIDVQSGYPWGSPEREAINLSYGQTQRYMLIAATCIYATMFVSVALWRNVDVKTSINCCFSLLSLLAPPRVHKLFAWARRPGQESAVDPFQIHCRSLIIVLTPWRCRRRSGCIRAVGKHSLVFPFC